MEGIRNFAQLLPNIATSGQPTEEQFSDIASAGYEAVVNLAMPSHSDAIDSEGKVVTELGMAYFHVPVPFDNPKREHVRLFCRLMEALQGKQVWVHCIMNYRVSVFMYHYLSKVEKLSKTQSISPVLSIWKPDSKWQEILSLTCDEIGL